MFACRNEAVDGSPAPLNSQASFIHHLGAPGLKNPWPPAEITLPPVSPGGTKTFYTNRAWLPWRASVDTIFTVKPQMSVSLGV